MELPVVGTVNTPLGSCKILTSIRSNGRIKNFVVPSNCPSRNDGEIPFCCLQRNSSGNILLGGLYMPEKYRGRGLGHLLQEIAFRVCESLGQQPNETNEINKPVVALLLKKYGFSPDDESNRFLLYKQGSFMHNGTIPEVCRLSGKKSIKQRSAIGIPHFQITKKAEDVSGEEICLGTPYVLLDDELFQTKRSENNTNFCFSDLNIY